MTESTLYIGTKQVLAYPMTRQAYNDYRGWTLPADENGADEGYLVEYVDGGQANHPAHTGYISWSPKAVFERAYYALKGMTFGQALEALQAGKRVSRAGWNGKGMYLFLVPGLPESGPPSLPCIGMYTATGAVLHGWLASQTDMLVSDWQVVES